MAGTFDHVQNAKQRAFLEAYAICGTMSGAEKASKCSRRNHVYWMHGDPAYPDLFQQASDAYADSLVAEVRRRALEGVRKPVLYRGEQVKVQNPETGKMELYWETVYSDTLLIFELKKRRPEYRDAGFDQANATPSTIKVRPLGGGNTRSPEPDPDATETPATATDANPGSAS